jgi:hypothetical protein
VRLAKSQRDRRPRLYPRQMSVELYRDYEALERPPRYESGANDFLRWCERRQAQLARLERSGDYIQGGVLRWQALLTLAYLYGWRPQGTTHEASEWSGTYFSNDGQRVREGDAQAIAGALRRAQSSVSPLAETMHRWRELPAHHELFDASTIESMAEKLLVSELSRRELQRWVSFFEGGGFTIW